MHIGYCTQANPQTFNMVPVDYCTYSIVAACVAAVFAFSGRARGGDDFVDDVNMNLSGIARLQSVFHVVNQRFNTLVELLPAIGTVGVDSRNDIREVGWQEWCRGVDSLPPTHALFSFKERLKTLSKSSAPVVWGDQDCCGMLARVQDLQETPRCLNWNGTPCGAAESVLWCPVVGSENIRSMLVYLKNWGPRL